MAEGKIFVGRKAELEQFKEVLKNPKGQAVLVVGQATMGKTWLVNRMAEIAEKHPKLKCGWVRYELTKEDSVDSRLAIMIDDAFEAASNPKKFWGGDDRGKKQWVALYKVLEAIPSAGKVFEAIRGLAKSLKRDVSKDSRQQFVVKLKLISKKMPSNGRAIFIVDPEKYMRPGSDEAWAIVVKQLPEKIKFIFAQRPEDVLVESETFGALDNVSKIPEERLDILDEESVDELIKKRVAGLKYSVTEVREVLSKYKGHPYAVGAALDLLKAGVPLAELPKKAKPIKFAEAQWKKVRESGPDAIKLFEAYSILEGRVPDEIVEEASGLDSAKVKSVLADTYIESLFREEAGGKRIYHVILEDKILSGIREVEEIGYIERAAHYVFISKKMGFFEKARFIDLLLNVECVCQQIANELNKVFAKDETLACYFYERNDYKDEPNPEWIRFLREAGEFKDLEATEVTRLSQMKATYLSEVAEEKPKEVLDIILCSDAKDAVVRSRFLDVILKKSSEYINEGTMLIKKYMDGRNYESWHFVGEQAAKFMVAIAKVDIDKAFDVAKMLLEVWKREKKEVLSKDIEAKFKAHEYKDLVFKYYKKMWEADGIRAGKQMAEIFDNYIKEIGEDDYSVQNGFYVKLERLDQIEEKFKRDIIAIVVGGICEAGKVVIEKQPDKANDLLDYLWSFKKTIFERILMYLLRFVPDGTQRERISSIIGNRKFLELPYWQYEYKLLLRDKYEEISEEAIQVFKNWVEEPEVDDIDDFAEWFERTRGRKYTQEDLEKYESRIKATKLFLVREKFTGLYEKHREKSGASDEELMPKPMVRTGRRIGPTEGSPVSVEDMVKMEPQGAVEYLADPSRWKIDKKKESFFHTPEEDLGATFEKAVQQRLNDYAELSRGELNKLKPIFLKRYFHGAWNALREKQVKEESLVKILQRANNVIVEKKDNEDYEGVYSSIIYVVEGIFEDEELRKKLVKSEGELIWKTIEPLSKYKDKKYETDRDEDPHQKSINCVAGKAFTLVVRFGLSYKNENSKTYEKEWSGKIRSVLDYVVNNVKDARVISVLGVWFPQLHWLEKKWIETNLDKIFDISDNKAWDIVWGTYMSWGIAYKDVFYLLVESGKYDYAVEKIESGIYRKHDKNPDEGLVEHLMIGYFNEWIEFDDNLLKKFFEKATAKLRSKAARFLTTGFKSVNEEGGEQKEKAAKRMKEYWEKRLEAIREKPEKNKVEAVEFTGWVEDSLLGPKETLELLVQTLKLSGGEFGQMRDIKEFIEEICELGKGNELIALRCLKKAVADENMRMPWARYEERLVDFLEQIGELANDYEDVEDILNEAVEVADLYGRLQPDKFREIWEKLNKRLRERKV